MEFAPDSNRIYVRSRFAVAYRVVDSSELPLGKVVERIELVEEHFEAAYKAADKMTAIVAGRCGCARVTVSEVIYQGDIYVPVRTT